MLPVSSTPFSFTPMEPSSPLPLDSHWTIPDDIVDSPYDREPAPSRTLHLGRRVLLVTGLLFLLATCLTLGILAIKSKSLVRFRSAASFASTNPPPASSRPSTIASETPSSSNPSLSSSTATSFVAATDSVASPLLPSATAPSSPTPGNGDAYLIHQVSPGESLEELAQANDTSIDVLIAANQPIQTYATAQAVLASANVELQGASLPPGIVVVILPHQKDPAGVPRFKVIYINVETSVSSLAGLHSVSVDDLRSFNDLGDSNSIPAGRYLIIPEK